MDPLYFQPYSYVSSDADGVSFTWPAVLRPSGPTIGGRRITMQQAPKSNKAWTEGDKELILVPVNLVGQVTFDSENDANGWIANAHEHIAKAVSLVRLEKQGPLILGASYLIPTFDETRGNTVNLTVVFIPEKLPIYEERVVNW